MSSFSLFITCYFTALNVLLGALQIGLLRRRRPYPRFLAVGICGWAALMMILFFVQAFSPEAWGPVLRQWLYLPISAEMIWNLLMLQPLVLLSILVTLALRWGWPVSPAAPTLTGAELSRRKFIYLAACGAAPAVALGMGVHGTDIRYDLRVRRFDLPFAHLPPELEGFTIAHVSDLHSGIFCGPRRLKIISDATNDLKADLVVVTGDFINHSMAEFPDSLATMQRLRAPSGVFLCEGNHDVLPGPRVVAQACVENGLRLLYDQTAIVSRGESRLVIGGLPWLRPSDTLPAGLVSDLYPKRQRGDFRILLAHHPELFDLAQSADLVLSGHTHGGQIMLGEVGLGSLFFKYWSGFYRRADTTLIVSNGCGDWFPCRIGAPAEVGLLTLRKAT